MRLEILKNGHTFLQKVQLSIIKIIMGQIPGPIATLSYNRDFFGKHYALWLQNRMRKMDHWNIGEVELMAAYVSKLNQCQYCTTDHISVATNTLDKKVIKSVMDNVETAPVSNQVKLTLLFLKKLTTSPHELTKDDITLLKEAKLSEKAIEEAIHICGVFCVMNRLADAFNFELSSDSQKVGKFLFKNGYSAASVLG